LAATETGRIKTDKHDRVRRREAYLTSPMGITNHSGKVAATRKSPFPGAKRTFTGTPRSAKRMLSSAINIQCELVHTWTRGPNVTAYDTQAPRFPMIPKTINLVLFT